MLSCLHDRLGQLHASRAFSRNTKARNTTACHSIAPAPTFGRGPRFLGAQKQQHSSRRQPHHEVRPPCRIDDEEAQAGSAVDALAAAIQSCLAGRAENEAQAQIVAAEVQLAFSMLQQTKALPPECRGPLELAQAVVVITDLTAAENDFQTLQVSLSWN